MVQVEHIEATINDKCSERYKKRVEVASEFLERMQELQRIDIDTLEYPKHKYFNEVQPPSMLYVPSY